MKFIKIFQVSIIILLTSLVLCACNQKTKVEETNPEKEVNNNWLSLFRHNYTINFPKEWTLDTTGVNNTEFIIVSQRIDSLDQFSENINLVAQGIENISLADYVQASEKEIAKFMTDTRITESRDFFKGNLKYHKTVFKATNQGVPFIFEQYYVVANQTAYVLTYSAEASSYENMQPIANEVMSSFELIN